MINARTLIHVVRWIGGKLDKNVKQFPLTADEYKGRALNGLGDIQAGDVLVKYNDGSIVNGGISIIESLNPLNPIWFVHTACVTDALGRKLHALEMSGDGLCCNDLSTTNRDYGYEVFRPASKKIISEVNKLMPPLTKRAAQKTPITYNYTELAKAIVDTDRLVTEPQFDVGYANMVNGTGNEKYYCSQFIAWLYQGASYKAKEGRLWPGSEHIAPAAMALCLKLGSVAEKRWIHVGHLGKGKR